MIRDLYKRLDPPDEPTKFSRKLTREKTAGGPEYVCTVRESPRRIKQALRAAGYRPGRIFSTVKYIRTPGGYSWEVFNLAKNRFNPTRKQQHCYAFRGLDDRIHLHHHREYPIVRPVKHQSDELRTPGDPDGALRGALSRTRIGWETWNRPVYK